MVADNPNPTVLSPADLPSRRSKREENAAASRKSGIEELFLAKPSYTMDPFYASDFSDTESDDSTLEPIDEQEIYGEFGYSPLFELGPAASPALCSCVNAPS